MIPVPSRHTVFPVLFPIPARRSIFLESAKEKEDEVSVIVSSAVENTGGDNGNSSGDVNLVQ